MSFTPNELLQMLRNDGISEADIPDTSILSLVTNVKSIFDVYKPINAFKLNGIVTVADQQSYNFPLGAQQILDVLWTPSISYIDVESLLRDITLDQNLQTFDAPSLVKIFNSKYYQYIKSHGGDWEILRDSVSNEEKIILYPIPQKSNINVPVIFTKLHADDLSTISDSYKMIFYEGLLIKVDEYIVRKLQRLAGFRAGTYSVSSESISRRADINTSKYNSWINKLSFI